MTVSSSDKEKEIIADMAADLLETKFIKELVAEADFASVLK